MATITAKAAGGKWSATTTWEPEQVPTAADDVILASASGSVEMTAEAFCRSLEASAYTKTFSLPAQILVIGTSTGNAGLALALGKGMTLTVSSSTFKFVSTAAEVQTIATAGHVMPRVIFKAPGGKWQLQDKYEAGGGRIELEEGELNTNGQQCKLEAGFRSTGTAARILSLGTSAVLLTGTGAVWEVTMAGLMLSIGSATIEVTNTATTLKTFGGGGGSYPAVTYSGNYIEVRGANTFAALNVNTARKATTVKGTLVGTSTTLTVTEGTLPAVGEELKGTGIPTGAVVLSIISEPGKTVEMSAAATETVPVAEGIEVFPAGLLFKQGETQTVAALTTNGKAGELARLASSLSGKPATITKATGQVSVNFMIIKDSKAAGTTEWYAGTGSRNATGNSVWKFEAAPPFFEGTASVRSGIHMGASGAKVTSGVAATTAGVRNVPVGAKTASGGAVLPSASRLTALGAKLATGVPALRSAARTSAVAAGKSTAGEGRVRSAVEVQGESSELQRSGRSAVPTATRTTATASKGAQGAGSLREALRAVSVAAKSTSGTANTRSGVNVSAIAGRLASGTATIRAAIRALGAGAKTPTGEAKIAAAARNQATGVKGGVGAPTVSAGVRQSATGSRATAGSSQLPVANQIAVLVSKTTVGEALLRVAARWVALTRPKATTLTAVTRSPTTLSGASRAPTTLTAVSRSPTTLKGRSA